MSRLGTIRQLLTGPDETPYRCLACQTHFEQQYQVCPECDGYDIRHTEWLNEGPPEERR